MQHSSVTHIDNARLKDLTLEVGFENSDPHAADSADVDGDTYVIRQHLEEGAPHGYSFHLHVAFVNCGARAETVPLRIIWAEKNYDFCHDYMYIGYDSGAKWQMLSTESRDGVTELKLVVPRGRHLLCCSPKFDVADYLRLLAQYENVPAFKRINVGTTEQGHPISCIRCGNPDGKKCVVTTRAHGYETAGAYCIDGWLEHVASASSELADVLGKLDIYLFPMINPDAVAVGNCCLSPSGVNFGKELAIGGDRDRGARELAAFILDLRPDVYLDMHNNTGPHYHDALRSTNPSLLKRLAAALPDASRNQKTWAIREVKFDDGYLLTVCEQRFGTIPVLTEFPWYTRLAADMKEHGRRFLGAFFSVIAANRLSARA